MRFKFSHTTVLLTVATYVLYLGVRGDLDLYIHPRYIVFTIVMATIGGAVLFINGLSNATHDDSDTHIGDRSWLMLVPLIVLVSAALILPAQTLSSSTVSQRITDAGSLIATAESRPVSTLFAGSSRGLRISDWSRILDSNTDPAYYTNKPAKISGFAYDAGLGDDTVWLARFVLTCCAVDAQPIGVAVRIPDWKNTYQENDWIAVEGEFSLQPTAQGEQIVLVPETVDAIDEPENPYAN